MQHSAVGSSALGFHFAHPDPSHLTRPDKPWHLIDCDSFGTSTETVVVTYTGNILNQKSDISGIDVWLIVKYNALSD